MNFKKLDATILQTGESFVLYENGKFQNFDKLHSLVGSDYYNLNDDLMDGITERDGAEWTHHVYEFGEIVLSIHFKFTAL